MNKNGIVLQKRDIDSMINEGKIKDFFNRLTTDYGRINDAVNKLAIAIDKTAQTDNELQYFFSNTPNYTINFGREISTSTYLVAKNCFKMLYPCVGTKYECVAKWCKNMEDTLNHEREYAISDKILNDVCGGSKYVACNLWKLLTCNEYEQFNPKMPKKITDYESFCGPIGNLGVNECRYTNFMLMWQLAKQGAIKLITDDEVKDILTRAKTLALYARIEKQNYVGRFKKNVNNWQIEESVINKNNTTIEQNTNNQQQTNLNETKGGFPLSVGRITIENEDAINGYDTEKLFDKVDELWTQSVEKYSKYFGNAVRNIFVLPQNFVQAIDDKGDFEPNENGSEYINAKISGSDDSLIDAIVKARNSYGIEGGFDWAKWGKDLANGIASSFNR